MEMTELNRVGEFVFEIPEDYRADMRVPARVIADPDLLEQIKDDLSLQQLVNVTTLPGIEFYALGMPDIHQGYGFPVGGVAATKLPDGVISPGGIGFDINCGVRLVRTNVRHEEVEDLIEPLVHEMSRSIPSGYGRKGRLSLARDRLDGVLDHGAEYVVRELGLGELEDLEFMESLGRLKGADSVNVSERAKERGSDQLGTLGGGNHFLEVQVVDEVFDGSAAEALGLEPGEITVLIHSGSRGLGHQVCTDYLKSFDKAMADYGIELPDRQLACAPLSSGPGQKYFRAMCAAANFAFSNRQVLMHRVRQAFVQELSERVNPKLELVYDVAHNIAKIEEYGEHKYCVHRKGATRAFGPSQPEIPVRYGDVGQPVFIPGSMGTSSFVLVGTDESAEVSLNSTCHGAGRQMSRTAAKKEVAGSELRRELESRGIVVRCPSNAELAEEAPRAYKDVDRVVDVVANVGIAKRVARLRPIGVLKG